MENAAKALMIAASVLIGIMIISLAVYLFATFGATSKQIHEEIDANRLNEFNTQFTVYETKNDNTIYDIISVINLAKENNEYYELNEQLEGNFYIKVNIGNTQLNLEKKTKQELDDLVKQEQNNMESETIDGTTYDNQKLPTYSCKVTISEKTGRVSTVVFY